MAEIRQYRKEKQKIESKKNKEKDTEQNEVHYKRKLKAHKQRMLFIAIVIGLAVVIAIIVICIHNATSSYSEYKVSRDIRRADNGNVEILCDANGYMLCSRDGVVAYSFDGMQKWNYSYEVDSISIEQSGTYFAVASELGNKIYLFNGSGYVSTITASLPIASYTLSSSGAVAAILNDADADYVKVYNSTGDELVNIKTVLTGNGVPMDITFSDNNKILMVSYAEIDGMKISTDVVFYNFGEVGQSESERIVGGFDYDDQLVADVEFIGSSTTVAVGENTIGFYKISEYPSLIKDIDIDYKIQKVFYSNQYVGVVHNDETGNNLVDIYDTSGVMIFTADTDGIYTNYFFTESAVVMYSDTDMKVLNMNGKEIFKYTFEDYISYMGVIEGNRDYLYVTDDRIYTIRLE